jgi:signal transduction histidine kinase
MASQGPELGQMLSLLSHELRSPLGVVRGYLRLLNQHQGELSANHRQAVTAALAASDRCVELLAQASALAHMWRQETPIEQEPIVLADLLQPLAHSLRTTDDRPLPVVIESAIDVLLTGDRALLHTALSSLVSAVHRAQPEEVAIRITSRTASGGVRDGVAIHCAPDGESMDAATEGALDLRRGGLGLALPMAAAIVEAHGGFIAERRAGARTAMLVWLPTT